MAAIPNPKIAELQLHQNLIKEALSKPSQDVEQRLKNLDLTFLDKELKKPKNTSLKDVMAILYKTIFRKGIPTDVDKDFLKRRIVSFKEEEELKGIKISAAERMLPQMDEDAFKNIANPDSWEALGLFQPRALPKEPMSAVMRPALLRVGEQVEELRNTFNYFKRDLRGNFPNEDQKNEGDDAVPSILLRETVSLYDEKYSLFCHNVIEMIMDYILNCQNYYLRIACQDFNFRDAGVERANQVLLSRIHELLKDLSEDSELKPQFKTRNHACAFIRRLENSGAAYFMQWYQNSETAQIKKIISDDPSVEKRFGKIKKRPMAQPEMPFRVIHYMPWSFSSRVFMEFFVNSFQYFIGVKSFLLDKDYNYGSQSQEISTDTKNTTYGYHMYPQDQTTPQSSKGKPQTSSTTAKLQRHQHPYIDKNELQDLASRLSPQEINKKMTKAVTAVKQMATKLNKQFTKFYEHTCSGVLSKFIDVNANCSKIFEILEEGKLHLPDIYEKRQLQLQQEKLMRLHKQREAEAVEGQCMNPYDPKIYDLGGYPYRIRLLTYASICSVYYRYFQNIFMHTQMAKQIIEMEYRSWKSCLPRNQWPRLLKTFKDEGHHLFTDIVELTKKFHSEGENNKTTMERYSFILDVREHFPCRPPKRVGGRRAVAKPDNYLWWPLFCSTYAKLFGKSIAYPQKQQGLRDAIEIMERSKKQQRQRTMMKHNKSLKHQFYTEPWRVLSPTRTDCFLLSNTDNINKILSLPLAELCLVGRWVMKKAEKGHCGHYNDMFEIMKNDKKDRYEENDFVTRDTHQMHDPYRWGSTLEQIFKKYSQFQLKKMDTYQQTIKDNMQTWDAIFNKGKATQGMSVDSTNIVKGLQISGISLM